MAAIIRWLEAAFGAVPAPLLEVWGRVAYVLGAALALCAFGGFTFRRGNGWGFGRERQSWDARAVWSIPLTFLFVTASGYAGSFIVLVPGAQTFESLKDLAVFVCVLCFGYPALLTVPFAYGISDLVEGVPPEFLLNWLEGYFINPACFWLAYQLLGKDPDFRRARTWLGYAVFVVIFMATEPVLWGYICSEQFTPAISYRSITPALVFTTGVTWVLAPVGMLVALPLARRAGLFWAEIPGHVRERPLGGSFVWEAGAPGGSVKAEARGLPIRLFILAPFIGLVLVMVGATAYVSLKSAEADATKLASRLHEEVAKNIAHGLDEYWTEVRVHAERHEPREAELDRLLAAQPIAKQGGAFILDEAGRVVASSERGAPVLVVAAKELGLRLGGRGASALPLEYRFDHITAQPLSRETWLASAERYLARGVAREAWTVVTVLPEAYYLAGVRKGNSRSALVFALALLLSLAVAAALASNVTGPLKRTVQATSALAAGELATEVPASHLEELDVLARSFNEMAARVRANEQHLERLVGSRTRELERARDEADAASRAKSAFLANMSHQIRTPMNAIMGFGQLLAKDGRIATDNRELVARILASGQHLIELIDNVLAMSKLEAGSMEQSVTSFDLHAAITVVSAMVEPRLEEKHVAFAVEGVEDVPRYVRADAANLRRILSNLLANAAKFTRAGRVSLRLSVPPEERLHVRFEVADTGAGMSQEALERLFVPFEPGKDDPSAGAGLGAALSRDLARLMGGELEVRSVLGAGTTFVLTLPVERVEAVELASFGSVPPPPVRSHAPLPTRDDVAALGADVVLELRRAIDLGYVARVPSILAPASSEHPHTVAELSRLANELELETLTRLLGEAP